MGFRCFRWAGGQVGRWAGAVLANSKVKTAKNVLAIENLFQNLKKSTFKL